MQEKSLESTEIFKIFQGSILPYPPSVCAFGDRYFALNIYDSEPLSMKPSYAPVHKHEIIFALKGWGLVGFGPKQLKIMLLDMFFHFHKLITQTEKLEISSER